MIFIFIAMASFGMVLQEIVISLTNSFAYALPPLHCDRKYFISLHIPSQAHTKYFSQNNNIGLLVETGSTFRMLQISGQPCAVIP
jgi:hypothetical protein